VAAARSPPRRGRGGDSPVRRSGDVGGRGPDASCGTRSPARMGRVVPTLARRLRQAADGAAIGATARGAGLAPGLRRLPSTPARSICRGADRAWSAIVRRRHRLQHIRRRGCTGCSPVTPPSATSRSPSAGAAGSTRRSCRTPSPASCVVTRPGARRSGSTATGRRRSSGPRSRSRSRSTTCGGCPTRSCRRARSPRGMPCVPSIWLGRPCSGPAWSGWPPRTTGCI
jgi:hypothetical protein